MKKIITSAIFTLGIGFIGGYFVRDKYIAEQPGHIELPEKRFDTDYVERVVDGDTLVLKNGIYVKTYRIRMLGLNTLELNKRKKKQPQPYANEAAQLLEDLVIGRQIRIEKDVSKEIDGFSRALRYIIIDDKYAGEQLILEGYGEVFMSKRLEREDALLKAEKEAKENKKGIWSLSPEELEKIIKD